MQEEKCLAEPFIVAPEPMGHNNRGDRAELWKVRVAKSESNERTATALYQVKVDSITCAPLSIFRIEK